LNITSLNIIVANNSTNGQQKLVSAWPTATSASCTEYINTSCATCRQIRTSHSCTHRTALAASQTACFIQTGFK